MKSSAEKVGKNTVALEVELEADKFNFALNQAYKKVVQKVNIPGFRKGKAPRLILERYVGKEALYNEAVELVLPDAYMKAVEETGIQPVADPELDLVQVEENKPFVFKATVVVKPEVNLGQYTGLSIAYDKEEITGETVEKELQILQNRHAKLLTMEEGTVQHGDMVTMDFEGRTGEEPIEGGKASDYTLEIGSGSFIPGFEDQIVGMNIGETGEIDVTFPDNYQNEDLSGKPARFSVTVKLIKRKELSPLDDEFAKDVSEFDTLEELREDMANKLKEAADRATRGKIRSEAINRAVDNAEVEIPEVMIERRVEDMINNMAQRLSNQGITMDKYFEFAQSNLEELKEKTKPDAERTVKQSLVLEAVAKVEGLSVKDEEVEEEFARISGEVKQDLEVVRKLMQNQVQYIKESLLQDKTVQFLVDKAILVEGTDSTGTESPEGTNTPEAE